MIPVNLNYNFPIPIENNTDGKYSDEFCWKQYKELEEYLNERDSLVVQLGLSKCDRPEFVVDISWVKDTEAHISWIRFEMKGRKK